MSEEHPFEELRKKLKPEMTISKSLLDNLESSEGKSVTITASIAAAVVVLEQRVVALERRNKKRDDDERLAL